MLPTAHGRGCGPGAPRSAMRATSLLSSAPSPGAARAPSFAPCGAWVMSDKLALALVGRARHDGVVTSGTAVRTVLRPRTRTVWGTHALLSAAVSAIVALAPSNTTRGQAATYTFPVHVHVAYTTPDHGQADRWLDDEIAQANSRFHPAGVQFMISQRSELVGPGEALDSAEALVALIAAADDQTAIDVFVVRNLTLGAALRHRNADSQCGVGVPPGIVSGLPGFVAVMHTGSPDVLAHELGHYFGLEHVSVDTNVMFPVTTLGESTFDPTQLATIGNTAQLFASRGEPPVVATSPGTSGTDGGL